jgi:hypothetical protein
VTIIRDNVKALQEADRRGREALRVYRPRPDQLPFHLSLAYFRALIGGNRSGKTTGAAIEFGSAALRIPIQTESGPLPFNWPTDPALFWVVGYDWLHIGQTIFHELFEEGKYKVIRRLDEEARPMIGEDGFPLYETFQPWRPDHVARKSECKPVGPIIPERCIKGGFNGIGWESRSLKEFKTVPLVNGSEIRAYSSTGQEKQGDAVDGIWVDEDLADASFIPELEARLLDKGGRIIWSAKPMSNNDALYNVAQRAEGQKGRDKPNVEAFFLSTLDNPFLAQENKDRFAEGLTEAEAQARLFGGFMFDAAQIYNDYKPGVHGVHNERSVGGSDRLTDLYAERGELPKEWTRYLAIDPGWNTTAVLVGTVPPPEEWGELLIIEKELRLPRHDYGQLAKEIHQSVGHWQFEAFLMDMHMGRQHHVGQARAVWEGFADAFKAIGFASFRSRYEFEAGNDNIDFRREATRERFRNGTLRICIDKTPFFQTEIKKYRLAIRKGEVSQTVVGREHDLMDCLEYLVAESPRYVPPRPARPEEHEIARQMRRIAEMTKRNSPRDKSTYLAAS